MKTKIDRNVTNLLLVALVLAVVTISCTRVREMVKGPSQSEKVRKLNSEVPSGVKYAEPVYLKESSFVIILSDINEILLNNADSQPIDVAVLNERIAEYIASTPMYDARVYIKAPADRDPRTFVALLNEIRKHDIDTVSLLVSSRVYDENTSDFAEGRDIPEPDRAFEVKIRAEVYDRPNPLTLIVSRKMPYLESIEINSEGFRDHEEMRVKLNEIFQQREMNGDFREGTNEVEKAVWLKVDKQIGKYGDVVKFIDALKGAGASPVVLIDEGTQWEITKKRHETLDVNTVAPQSPPGKKVKTISGGVLNGRAVSLPKPAYPPAARAARASGAVNVQVTVDIDGNIVSASAVSGHPLLRHAAEQAARSAKFAPTLLGGERVNVTGIVTYNFAPDAP
jgi:TonB family protein